MRLVRMFIPIMLAFVASCASDETAAKQKRKEALDPVALILQQTLYAVRTYEGPDKEGILRFGIMRMGDARKVYLARGKKDLVQADQIERTEHTLQVSLHLIYHVHYNEIGDAPRALEELRTACLFAEHSFVPPDTWKERCEDILLNSRT